MSRVTRYTPFAAVAALAGVLALPLPARAGNDGVAPPHDTPRRATNAQIEEKIGAHVPLELIFRDENDQAIPLGNAVAGKPTILVPVYYRCPMLCTEILNELVQALREMPPDFTAGNQFQVVTVSMDPLEHGDLARRKKDAYLTEYGRPGAEHGWRFLTGQKENIAELLDVIGYRFEFDKMLKEYNHPSGIVILSPDGKVTRYFHGLVYRGDKFRVDGPDVQGADGKYTKPTTSLRLSLIEAADGKGGSLLDRITLLCYRYDRLHQGYSLNVLRAVQIGGVITLAAVATFALLLVRREGILGSVLQRVGLFVLICIAVSGLGLGSSLWRRGDSQLATVLLSVSFLAVLAVTVIAYRRGRAARTDSPALHAPTAGAGATDALPPGGTA